FLLYIFFPYTTLFRSLSIRLNDEKEVVFKDSKFDVRANDMVLGAGFDKQRVFVGMIKNSKFNLKFTETNIFLYIPSLLLKYYQIDRKSTRLNSSHVAI